MEGLQLPEITFSGVISSIIFSGIGLYVFRQGKRRSQMSLIGLGIALMAYTYLTHGPLQDWGGGLLLCGITFYTWDRY